MADTKPNPCIVKWNLFTCYLNSPPFGRAIIGGAPERLLAYIKVSSSMLACTCVSWWSHQMETISALMALCAGNSPATGEFPSQRTVTRSLGVFFGLCLNKRLSKRSWGWWFETPSRSLWRHCNAGENLWKTSCVYLSEFISAGTGTGKWFRIERRQVVFLWCDQDSNPGVSRTHSHAACMPAHKPTAPPRNKQNNRIGWYNERAFSPLDNSVGNVHP